MLSADQRHSFPVWFQSPLTLEVCPWGKLRRSVVPVERKKHLRLHHEKQHLSFTAPGVFPIIDLFTFCSFCCRRAAVSSLDQHLQTSVCVCSPEMRMVPTLWDPQECGACCLSRLVPLILSPPRYAGTASQCPASFPSSQFLAFVPLRHHQQASGSCLPVTGFFIFLLIFLRKREEGGRRERGTSICYSTYLCIHCLILVRALTRDQTRNLGVSGQRFDQLSYSARACYYLYYYDCVYVFYSWAS